MKIYKKCYLIFISILFLFIVFKRIDYRIGQSLIVYPEIQYSLPTVKEYDKLDNFIKSYNNNISDDEIKQIKKSVKKYGCQGNFVEYKYGQDNVDNLDFNIASLKKNDNYYIYSIMAVESEFKKKANSYLGKEYGRSLMQVSEIGLTDYNNKHWKEKNIEAEELYDIDTNIKVGCWIFFNNVNYGIETLSEQIIAYNEGHKSAKQKSTSSYLEKVLSIYNSL